MKSFIVTLILFFSVTLFAEEPILSEHAPKDKLTTAANHKQLEAYHKAQEPYIKRARETYPTAKEKYLKGLPPGEHFFLTTRLYDDQNREEQVFVLVKSIEDGKVDGIIYNNINVVTGYQNGQKHSFPESEIYDWLITKPDGREEGNFVGKFIDTYQN